MTGTEYTGLPLGPCFDDVDLAPWCQPNDTQPLENHSYQSALDNLHQVVIQALTPWPSAHRAAQDALRQWALKGPPQTQ